MGNAKLGKDTNPLPKIDSAAPVRRAVYEVLRGFNFGCKGPDDDGTRVEPGPLTHALPLALIEKLLKKGALCEVREVKAK